MWSGLVYSAEGTTQTRSRVTSSFHGRGNARISDAWNHEYHRITRGSPEDHHSPHLCVIRRLTPRNRAGRPRSEDVPSKQSLLPSSRDAPTQTPVSKPGAELSGPSPANARPLAPSPPPGLWPRRLRSGFWWGAPGTPGETHNSGGDAAPPFRLGCLLPRPGTGQPLAGRQHLAAAAITRPPPSSLRPGPARPAVLGTASPGNPLRWVEPASDRCSEGPIRACRRADGEPIERKGSRGLAGSGAPGGCAEGSSAGRWGSAAPRGSRAPGAAVPFAGTWSVVDGVSP